MNKKHRYHEDVFAKRYQLKQGESLVFHSSSRRLLALSALSVVLGSALAEDKVLNIYSARHYPTDEALYGDFTKATGIT